MTLADHAAAGVATALIFKSNPVLAFFAAFLSHFPLDAISHWHYPLKSFTQKDAKGMAGEFSFNKNFVWDLGAMTADFLIGAFPALMATKIFQGNNYLFVAALGVVGGVLPDALQFVYYLSPDSLLRYLQNFHLTIHGKKNLDDKPLLGIPLQIILGIICLAAIAVI